MLVGGLISGVLGDLRGRRTTLLQMLMCNACFGLLTAAAPTMGLIMLARFGCGVGVGGAVPCVFSLVAEYSPSEQRG